MSPQTHIEWEAWRRVCGHLLSLNIDINNEETLCQVIKKWGIEYARLAKEFPKLLEESDR